MTQQFTNPILYVTGVPRSGSTFIGLLLSNVSGFHYCWEPFNPVYRRECKISYPFLGANSPEEKISFYEDLLSDTLRGRRINSNIKIYKNDNLFSNIGKSFGINKNTIRWFKYKVERRISPGNGVVLKDPTAPFISEFILEKNIESKIIVSYRPIKLVLESRKKRGWSFNLDIFKSQCDLMEYIKQLEFSQKIQINAWDSNVVQWFLAYQYLYEIKCKYPNRVFFLDHLKLVQNPSITLDQISEFLGYSVLTKGELFLEKAISGSSDEHKGENLAKLQSRSRYSLIKLPEGRIDIPNEVSNLIFKIDNLT